MNHNTRITRRLGAGLGLTALALGLAAAGAAPAQAESGTITYQCAIVPLHGEYDGTGGYHGPGKPLSGLHPMQATFDSALKNGAEVPVGTTVHVTPVEGKYTLSTSLVDELIRYSDGQLAEGTISFVMDGYISNARLKVDSGWQNLDYSLTAGSPVTVQGLAKAVNGTPGSFNAELAGPYEYTVDVVHAHLEAGNFSGYLGCVPDRAGKHGIDSFVAVESKPAPAPTPEPSRPSVVQTDAEQPANDAGMPSAAVAGILAFGVALAGLGRRASRRR